MDLDILGFLSNPLILFAIAAPIFIILGVLIGSILSQPRKNRVLQITPESGRAMEFNVKEEDAINVRCDPVGKTPPQRFIKSCSAYNVVAKGFLKLKHYALWLGRTGTAYTYSLKSEPVKLSLKETMVNVFGRELYDKIPEDQLNQIESGEINVTVEFPDVPLTPKDMPSLSSDDIRRGDIDHFINSLAKGIARLAKTGEGSFMRIIFILGTGIAIGIVLSLVFKWGSPTIKPST